VSFRWSDDEAEYVATTIERLLKSGFATDEIAVLARRRSLLLPVAEALQAQAIPLHNRDPRDHDHPAGVRLLTIHEAKGREFRAVFVVGLVESILPCVRPEMDRVAVRQELALARRQLYVAMTRASERLWLTGSEGLASRLLYELGLALTDGVEDAP
jgi:DNA helicase-2/ATP-dependent DNA helicase PcrA